MSKEEFCSWVESQDMEELARDFLKSKKLEEEFDNFIFDTFQSDIADYADMMYDSYKDDIALAGYEE